METLLKGNLKLKTLLPSNCRYNKLGWSSAKLKVQLASAARSIHLNPSLYVYPKKSRHRTSRRDRSRSTRTRPRDESRSNSMSSKCSLFTGSSWQLAHTSSLTPRETRKTTVGAQYLGRWTSPTLSRILRGRPAGGGDALILLLSSRTNGWV